MIAELSKHQEELYVNVRNDWQNRSRSYANTDYESNCSILLYRLLESQSLPMPAIIYLDSPFACLLAKMVVEKTKNEGMPGKTVIYPIIREILENITVVNQCFGITYDFNLQYNIIAANVCKALNKIDIKYQKSIHYLNGGNLLEDIFHSRNIEKVKKNISCFIWDEYFSDSPVFNSDFMELSLNLYTDCNGEYYPWTYHSFIFYDFITRLGLINDPLFNEARSLLLNDIFDIIYIGDVCFVSKLPHTITRNESGQLHSFNGYPAVEFADGYRLYFESGRRVSQWDIYNEMM